MGGKHRRGRHRKKPPIARKLALFGLLTSAVVVLTFAFSRSNQSGPESNLTTSPAPPILDLSVPSTQPIDSVEPETTKRPHRAPPHIASPQDQKDRAVTPHPPRPIMSTRASASRAVPQAVLPVTPRTSKPVSAERLNRAAPQIKPLPTTTTTIPQRIAPAKPTSSKAAPKVSPKVTATQRVVLSTPLRVSRSPQGSPAPKPPTIIVTPATISQTIPVVTSNPKCGSIGLQATPKAACNRVLAAFPQIISVLGVGSRAGNPASCHPNGLAIDFIVGTNKALGDRIFAFVSANRVSLGATPVILWQVQDHFDHVHVSFEPCKG
jgi:hypothetical protein